MLAMIATPSDTPTWRWVEKIDDARPLLRRLDRRVARRLHRHEREPHAQPAEEHQAADQPQATCRDRCRVNSGDGQRRGEQPSGHQPPWADPRVQPPGDRPTSIMMPNACGNVVSPLVSGVMAAQQLQVQRHHERQPEEAGHREQADEVALPEHPVAQQAQVQHRLGLRSSTTTITIAHATPMHAAVRHRVERPTRLRALAQRVDDQRQRRRRTGRTRAMSNRPRCGSRCSRR